MSGARAWIALAAVLGIGALAGHWLPREPLCWQSAHPFDQPWRWWSAAFVHLSARHLGANLAGLALVAALGRAAGLPRAATLAWLLAWPLTHLGLLLKPDLARYGGLSGVLHAGVVIAAWHLLRQHTGRVRAIGWALLAGVGLKLLLEAPWGPALRHPPDWDIAIAPFAHATGAAAGLLVALAIALVHRR